MKAAASASSHSGFRLCGWIDRRFSFHSRANVAWFFATLFLVGVATVLLQGQDANWDLRNYHLYNGYAWLHGRLSIDLAPAQLQSYFCPLLDAVHFLILTSLPARVAGLVLGGLHLLVAVPLAVICSDVLESHPQRARLVPLLTLAGLCSAAFLSEFATVMGDSITAVLVLGALAAVLRALRRERVLVCLLLAGGLVGLAVACKLTNAVFAPGLAVALLLGSDPIHRRVLRCVVVTGVALLVFAVVAGGWYMSMWHAFGNPLLPQFNGIFHAPLAMPVSNGDLRWLPKGWLEQLVWPLWFTLHPYRVGEVALVQCGWALVYVVAVGLLIRRLLLNRSLVRREPQPLAAPMLGFFLVSYLLWQYMFSVQRYLVALELLLPLMVWLGMRRLLPGRVGDRWACALVLLSAMVVLVGWKNWVRTPWAGEAYRVEQPTEWSPARSLVLLVGDEPQSWRIPFLPAQARYASVASNFPESSNYAEQISALVQDRPERYALLPTPEHQFKRDLRISRLNAISRILGWDHQSSCATLHWLKRQGVHYDVARDSAGRCVFVSPKPRQLGGDDAIQSIRQQAKRRLHKYGLSLDPASCVLLHSYIGAGDFPYQWCPLALAAVE